MEYTEHYDNVQQRNTICNDYESQSLRMLHDDFDSDWKRGDEPRGILTFTDEPAKQFIVEPIRDVLAEIDQIKADIKKLKGL